MEKDNLVYEEMTGIKEGYSAVLVTFFRDNLCNGVEIYAEDIDSLLPKLGHGNWTPQMVNDALRLFEIGMQMGERHGRANAQMEFRRCLGLDNFKREVVE